MKRKQGLALARRLKQRLIQQAIPVQSVFLFGSVAREQARDDSDIDIAVITLPFRSSRLDENVEVAKAREGIDLHIGTLCLHPEDLENKYSTIAQEIRRDGIAV